MKICQACGLNRPLEWFAKRKNTRDGRDSRCRECERERAALRRAANPEASRQAVRRYYQSHREERCEDARRRWRVETPKLQARNAIKYAVRMGTVVKPTHCTACGSSERRIEAHHEDYGRPLDVVWLCSRCHRHLRPPFYGLPMGLHA